MREIKFRAWDKLDKCFTSLIEGVSADGRPFFVDDDGVKDYRDDEWIVMQYTGLKDKNGVEIYEGDIVTGKGDAIERRLYQITWYDEQASFWAKLLTEDYDSMQRFRVGQQFSTGVATEVIGNILENKELLNERS